VEIFLKKFPSHGKARRQFFHRMENGTKKISIAWKFQGAFFHAREVSARIFPYDGKFQGVFFHAMENFRARFSMLWKFLRRAIP
jgi:hypothetical protein